MSRKNWPKVEGFSEDALDALFAAWDEDRRSASPSPLEEWIRHYPAYRDYLQEWAECAAILDEAERTPEDPGEARRIAAIGDRVIAKAREAWRADRMRQALQRYLQYAASLEAAALQEAVYASQQGDESRAQVYRSQAQWFRHNAFLAQQALRVKDVCGFLNRPECQGLRVLLSLTGSPGEE